MDIEKLEVQAEHGDLNAQIELSNFYGKRKEYDKAFKWVEKAAENDVMSKCNLGIMYLNGYGTEKNLDEAFYCFFEADQQGNTYATYMLGVCCVNGYGTQKNNDLAIQCFKRAAKKDNIASLKQLAEMYAYDGFIVEQNNREKAYSYLLKTEEIDGIFANLAERLGYYALRIGKKEYISSAKKHFEDAYRLRNKKTEYHIRILDELNGREIKSIESTSELAIEGIDENKIGAVYINPKYNDSYYQNTLYKIEDYIKCKEKIAELLENVDYVNETRDNELEVFMQIYVKLGKLLKYDKEQFDDEMSIVTSPENTEMFLSRNLIGGLMKQKCVCSGYAEILRNILLERGIECRCVNSDKHAYNQVKINGKWYYVDLTYDKDLIISEGKLENCLKSEETFRALNSEHINNQYYKVEGSLEDYPAEELDQVYRKVLKKYSDEDKVKNAIDGTELTNEGLFTTEQQEKMERKEKEKRELGDAEKM